MLDIFSSILESEVALNSFLALSSSVSRSFCFANCLCRLLDEYEIISLLIYALQVSHTKDGLTESVELIERNILSSAQKKERKAESLSKLVLKHHLLVRCGTP